ncbi:hypothetical protein DFH11DRAFT_1548124 [Phellopilus nigrolimitatus]|nr:hypothetical protein DFH11DRAFT_1548124 [Phellopilus nigrolimitatus]
MPPKVHTQPTSAATDLRRSTRLKLTPEEIQSMKVEEQKKKEEADEKRKRREAARKKIEEIIMQKEKEIEDAGKVKNKEAQENANKVIKAAKHALAADRKRPQQKKMNINLRISPEDSKAKNKETQRTLNSKVVKYVAITGLKSTLNKSNPNNNNQKLVHWRVHAGWPNDDPESPSKPYTDDNCNFSSVVYDQVKAGKDYVDITIEAQYKEYIFSKSIPEELRRGFKAIKEFTVQDLTNFIYNKARHCYHYDCNGSGCLYWSKVVLRDMVHEGWLADSALTEFDELVTEYKEHGEYWVPDDRGIFYDTESAAEMFLATYK